MATLTLTPKTSGVLTVTIAEGSAAVLGATVTAKVFTPQGALVAENVALTTQGNGEYVLAIDPDWAPTEGVYVAEVEAIINGEQFTSRFNCEVRW